VGDNEATQTVLDCKNNSKDYYEAALFNYELLLAETAQQFVFN
jgi:hypothetical protein